MGYDKYIYYIEIKSNFLFRTTISWGRKVEEVLWVTLVEDGLMIDTMEEGVAKGGKEGRKKNGDRHR